MLGGKDNAEVDGDKRIIGFGRAVDRMGIWLTGNGGVGGENEGSGWGERVESVGRGRGEWVRSMLRVGGERKRNGLEEELGF